ncbi:MAG: hypothetical protein HYU60_04235 [Magnetospirillum sp.]|nr:hypothetical protein [Magnetospirillum sp.]
MDTRRRSPPDKDNHPAAGDAEQVKLVKKQEKERRDYDFSVLKSLFDDEA